MENQECWEGSLSIDDMINCIQLLEDCFSKRLKSGPFRIRERQIQRGMPEYDGLYSLSRYQYS
jgi:hypothetical protein